MATRLAQSNPRKTKRRPLRRQHRRNPSIHPQTGRQNIHNRRPHIRTSHHPPKLLRTLDRPQNTHRRRNIQRHERNGTNPRNRPVRSQNTASKRTASHPLQQRVPNPIRSPRRRIRARIPRRRHDPLRRSPNPGRRRTRRHDPRHKHGPGPAHHQNRNTTKTKRPIRSIQRIPQPRPSRRNKRRPLFGVSRRLRR